MGGWEGGLGGGGVFGGEIKGKTKEPGRPAACVALHPRAINCREHKAESDVPAKVERVAGSGREWR